MLARRERSERSELSFAAREEVLIYCLSSVSAMPLDISALAQAYSAGAILRAAEVKDTESARLPLLIRDPMLVRLLDP